MSVSGHEQYMDFQAKARDLCTGTCELKPNVTTIDCGDGPAYAQIKACNSHCAGCIKELLENGPRPDQVEKFAAFEKARLAVGEPAIHTGFYNQVAEEATYPALEKTDVHSPASTLVAV